MSDVPTCDIELMKSKPLLSTFQSLANCSVCVAGLGFVISASTTPVENSSAGQETTVGLLFRIRAIVCVQGDDRQTALCRLRDEGETIALLERFL